MKKIIFFIFSLILYVSLYSQKKNYLFFEQWNKLTVYSLKSKLSNEKDSMIRSFYENRLTSITELYKMFSNKNEIKTSIRYSFSKKLNLNDKLNSFYIVEIVESGSKVSFKNYIIPISTYKNSKIELYTYTYPKWVKKGFIEKNHTSIKLNNDTLFVDFKTGFNNDDIIVTKVVNGKIEYSEYFLYTTLSKNSWINELFKINLNHSGAGLP